MIHPSSTRLLNSSSHHKLLNFFSLLLFVSHTRFKHPICEFVCALPILDGFEA